MFVRQCWKRKKQGILSTVSGRATYGKEEGRKMGPGHLQLEELLLICDSDMPLGQREGMPIA